MLEKQILYWQKTGASRIRRGFGEELKNKRNVKLMNLDN